MCLVFYLPTAFEFHRGRYCQPFLVDINTCEQRDYAGGNENTRSGEHFIERTQSTEFFVKHLL